MPPYRRRMPPQDKRWALISTYNDRVLEYSMAKSPEEAVVLFSDAIDLYLKPTTIGLVQPSLNDLRVVFIGPSRTIKPVHRYQLGE